METAEFQDANVLVTGGLGFIGSNLGIQLVQNGARLTVVDNRYSSGGANDFNVAPIRDKISLIVEDLGKCLELPRIVSDSDYVFDLAAQVSHVDSMTDPVLDLDFNCRSHLPLLEAVRRSSSNPKLVYTGSRVQYGRTEKIPVREGDPSVPVDNNGIAKQAYEHYCLLYNRAYGLKTTSLRLTNTYGPRALMRHSKQGFVNWFVRRCLEGKSIEIFGDGSQLRDFTYVDDVVDACLAAALAKSEGEFYNLGGFPATVLAVAETLRTMRPNTEVVMKPFPADRKAVEIGNYIADYSKFNALTGWKPRISLDEGLQRTVTYYDQNRSFYW